MADHRGLLGRELHGRYRLDRVLGEGAMGYVFAAKRVDKPHREDVAVKVLKGRASGDVEVRARFRREAKVAAAIRSPYVTAVLDAGIERDGTQWIAFELLRGESLDVRLRRDARLPVADVAWIVDDVLQALVAAHAAGVVHRDVKPGNVFLLTAARQAKMLDFGVAKFLHAQGRSSTSPLTAADEALGTPAYMSPEQFRNAREADTRADLYGLGVLTFRMLAGRYPFRGASSMELITAKETSPAMSLEAATGQKWPSSVEQFLAKSMAYAPEDRQVSAAAALEEWRALRRSGDATPLAATLERTAAAGAVTAEQEDTEVSPGSRRA